jgi:hypothetical protein
MPRHGPRLALWPAVGCTPASGGPLNNNTAPDGAEAAFKSLKSRLSRIMTTKILVFRSKSRYFLSKQVQSLHNTVIILYGIRFRIPVQILVSFNFYYKAYSQTKNLKIHTASTSFFIISQSHKRIGTGNSQ